MNKQLKYTDVFHYVSGGCVWVMRRIILIGKGPYDILLFPQYTGTITLHKEAVS